VKDIMDWKDKFRIVNSCIDTNEDIEQDFYIKGKGASSEFILKLKSRYPFVSEDYLQFLEITDGADIAQCRFLEEGDFDSIAGQYGQIYPKERWMPFGYEAGGDPLLLGNSGKVALGEGKANKEVFIILANSFSEFLCEVLMGQKYASVFRVEQDEYDKFYKEEIEDDPWLAFLVKNQWIIIG
jgi:hypothetical protein